MIRQYYLIFITAILPSVLWGRGEAVESYSRAAVNFLKDFTGTERSNLVRPADEQRMDRGGINLDSISVKQEKALNTLLQSVLRTQGLKKYKPIMNAEQSSGRYRLTFYGDPAVDSLWAWQIYGPELNLFISVNDSGCLSVTPSFWTEESMKGDKNKPLLYYERTLAFKLLNDLESFKKYQAVRSPVLPSYGHGTIDHDGLRLKEMSWDQMILFIRLINSHLGNFKREIARRYWDKIIEYDFKQLRFNWYGSLTPGQSYAYYIYGPSIEIYFQSTSESTYVYLRSPEEKK